jgi:hypothetical protein
LLKFHPSEHCAIQNPKPKIQNPKRYQLLIPPKSVSLAAAIPCFFVEKLVQSTTSPLKNNTSKT